MTTVLLSIHVLAVVLTVGPISVAASMFPPAARRAHAPGATDADRAVLRTLHRICRVYATIGVLVPVFGVGTATTLGVLGNAWLITAIALTAAAGAVLGLQILPRQAALLLAGAGREALEAPRRLAMATGAFNLLWALVTVLMIARPGSTTGA